MSNARTSKDKITISSIISDRILLALGSNQSGPWGSPRQTLARALGELSRADLRIVRTSHIFCTAPVGPGLQAGYLNAVLLVQTRHGPAALLRLVKQIERRAGRRLGRHWGPRSLDIDVLDHGGRRLGWPPGRRLSGRLVLPHPEMHARAFVLLPLLEVLPSWRHPVLGLPVRELLRRIGGNPRLGARQSLDFASAACDKGSLE